ncbi:hypothetical protein BpHYR1_003603 [Brachionus plicatilis]|uniref:Uncharacterized protein n=1 Tax=Brachionus plicatilis TaxID=10195 RepID=A0A3M7PFK4_BRAPC|nr:hypothetical protein BpHYR1_003603 [Brachionus plicatilis]
MVWEVIEEGEQALLYHFNGKISLRKGPKRLWLVASKLKKLEKITAHHNEYLAIEYLDGHTDHKQGPCTEFMNPMIHLSIQTKQCYCLDTNCAIVVVHKFSWHGEEENSKVKYEAGKNNFEILNCAPDQLYYNVDEVRTADDALLRIKVMIFYEIKDIKKMLNETKDPIADFLNCCKSDVIGFTTAKTYLNFIETCHLLNDLKNYTRLVERSEKIGFEVTKVVFRGYFASPKLQSLHDTSVKTRTDLRLNYEAEIQQQNQLDYNLKNEISRLQMEQDLEYQKVLNQLELSKARLMESNRILFEEEKAKIEINTKSKLKSLENLARKNEQKLEHLEKLNQMNIDLTEHLFNYHFLHLFII